MRPGLGPPPPQACCGADLGTGRIIDASGAFARCLDLLRERLIERLSDFGAEGVDAGNQGDCAVSLRRAASTDAGDGTRLALLTEAPDPDRPHRMEAADRAELPLRH